MAIVIKSLADSVLSSAGSFASVYPSSGTTTRPALVRSMRFVNRSDTDSATLTLQLTKGATSKRLSPAIVIPPKGIYVERNEITLGIEDAIKGQVGATGQQFDFVVSGIEREV